MYASASRKSLPEQGQDELASQSFRQKFVNGGYNSSVDLHICALSDAIDSLYLHKNKAKLLILYLHNEDTEFSRNFCAFLADKELSDILEKHFIILPWDIGDETYHEILIDSLNNVLELLPCMAMVLTKEPGLIFISSVDMDIALCTIMREKLSIVEFKEKLEVLYYGFCEQPKENMLVSEEINQEEQDASSGFSYEEFQQKMFDMLGNRDYDIFQPNEMVTLRDKIAFALFGMPSEIEGYSEKQIEERDKMFQSILEVNNEFSEIKDQVIMAVVYTCLLPLGSYYRKQEFTPVPVFVLRRCVASDHPCRSFIDHTRRAYKSWEDYLTDNKFCECLMIVPQDGRYAGDENEKVKLMAFESPACNIGKKVLKATDITSSVLGISSSSVMVAAAIPAIPVAPFVLVGAAAVGVGVGLYSIVRSASALVDRGMHNESLSLGDSEARGAYLNIAAGAVGFAGAGANAVVSQLAANGVTVGTTARIAVSTLGVANIGIGGLAVGNSAVDIFMRWWIDDETPTTLTILQLSTSILFFGHAVYSFKTAQTIIEETQANVMQDYKDLLKSNRQRKAFKKLELDTIRRNGGDVQRGNAEVISALVKIKNKDEVFAFLARSNKELNKMGIKFSAQDGEIVFNGHRVDLSEVSTIGRSDVYSFFSDLENNKSSIKAQSLSNNFDFRGPAIFDSVFIVVQELIRPISLRQKISVLITEVFYYFRTNSNLKILQSLRSIAPGRMYMNLMEMVLSFVKKQMDNLEKKFRNNEFDDSVKNFFKNIGDLNDVERKLAFAQKVVDKLLIALRSPTPFLTDLVTYCIEWIFKATIEKQEQIEQKEFIFSKGVRKSKQIKCKKCSGFYFN